MRLLFIIPFCFAFLCSSAQNDRCDLALDLAPIQSGEINGQVEISFPVESCAGYDELRGLWYRFIGNDSTIQLSTCSQSNLDTRLVLFTSNCGALSCLAANDDACGILSQLSYPTIQDSVYYVLVGGYDDATFGQFTLSADFVESIDPPINDDCANATAIRVYPNDSLDFAFLEGTTIMATADTTPNYCGTNYADASVWYQFDWNGSDALQVNLRNAEAIGLFIELFDDCNMPVGFTFSCQPILNDSFIVYESPSFDAGSYRLLVSSSDGQGLPRSDFEIALTYALPLENDDCVDAVELIPGNSVSGSTFRASATAEANGASCDNVFIPSNASGVWYRIQGNDSLIELSLENEPGFNNAISVFEDRCDSFLCVARNFDYGFNSEFNRFYSQVAFQSSSNESYLVLVSGRNQFDKGRFTLSSRSIPFDKQLLGNEKCLGAEILSVGLPGQCNEVILAQTTDGKDSNSDSILCWAQNERPDVWYAFNSDSFHNIRLETFRDHSYTSISVELFKDCNLNRANNVNYCNEMRFTEDILNMRGFSGVPRTYYMRISSDTFGFQHQTGDFALCLTASSSKTDESEFSGTIACDEVERVSMAFLPEQHDVIGGDTFPSGIIYGLDFTDNVKSLELISDPSSSYSLRVFKVAIDGALDISQAYLEKLIPDWNMNQANITIDNRDSLLAFVHVVKNNPTSANQFEIRLRCDAEINYSINDHCAEALQLNCGDTIRTSLLDSRLLETGSKCVTGRNASLWYHFEGSGHEMILSTCGSAIDQSRLSVYTGQACGFLNCSNLGIPVCGNNEALQFPTIEGQNYWVQVSHPHQMDGELELTLQCASPPPADTCFPPSDLSVQVIDSANRSVQLSWISGNLNAQYTISYWEPNNNQLITIEDQVLSNNPSVPLNLGAYSNYAFVLNETCDNGRNVIDFFPLLQLRDTSTQQVGIEPYADEHWQLVPNPSSAFIQIVGIDHSDIHQVQIIGLDGQVKLQLDGQASIDLSQLSAGTYIVRLSLDDGNQVYRRVLKQ